MTDKVFVGTEATWRNLTAPGRIVPLFGPPTGFFTDQEEQTHRVYLNALPLPELPVSVEVVYDRLETDPSLFTSSSSTPLKLETRSIPITARRFHHSGWFVGARGTIVSQSVDRDPARGLAHGDSSFFVLDADLGYRFPNQRGVFTIGARNLFDQSFRYQDDGFCEFGSEHSTGPYFPESAYLHG